MSRNGSLGLWSCTALVMGNMIGSGIFLLPAALAVYGGISLLGWVLTSAGALVVALVFARLASQIPRAGGPYAYARAGFGDFAAFLVAWGYWVSLLTGNAAIAVAMISYATVFFPVLGTSPHAGAVAAIAMIGLLTLVNIRGVREAGIVQLITTVLKILPLVAVSLAGLALFELEHFMPFNRSGQSGFAAVTASAALTLWAFQGLESATIPAAHVRDAGRTIPRATLLGTLLATIVYIAATVAVMGLVPPAELATSQAPFADAAAKVWGQTAALVIAAGAVVSCFGALNGWILNTGQIPAAAADDSVFPRLFGRRSRYATPAVSLTLSAILVCLLIYANYTRGLIGLFTFAILLSTMTALIPWAFASAAYLVVGNRDAGEHRRTLPWHGFVLGAVAFGYSVWAIAGTGAESVYWGFLLLLAGIPVYAVLRARGPQKSRP